ncbi:exonuclease SbcCD subunit D [Desulfuromonas carbonis]|uniref:exonuclease SbcCD subunit D n=1 Tax=Desulfuromonas sp. DDH964 TaxID=1823759 RepID=UPI00078B8301|nr:exonuclease SbcCD subunit D [Desulfuromonas sp. DDH964]AMV71633.1 DNA repair exonuclease SbcCD, D subunit [Desulfuromonas sp. DDH964]
MRILHTSDWHLGRQFHNVSLLDDQRYALEQVLEIIRARQVDVVLVAGDIYDRSVPPAAAVELLDWAVHAICHELKVPLILIAGNHDGPQRLAFGSRQLAAAGLHVAGPLRHELEPVVLARVGVEIAFYPLPYAEPATVRQVFEVEVSSHDQAMAFLLEKVRRHNGSGRPCVVIGHCFLAGGVVSESERPLALGGADQVAPEHFRPFAYAALGHLHGPQQRGAAHVRYSGSLLKYSFSEERQRKGVTLVELDAAGKATIEQIPLTPRRDMRILEGSLAELLAAGASDPGRDDYLLVRLTDSHAILDVMSKLREVYPNVLHLERPGLMGRGEAAQVGRERLKQGELAMFEDFFDQVAGEPLSDAQRAIVSATIEALHREVE